MSTRLADLLAGLSRTSDVGFALPMGTAARSCVLASRLARSLGLPAEEVQAAFYTSLLHHVGCVGYAHETARLFGDELAASRAAARSDPGSPRDFLGTFLPVLTRGRPPVERLRLTVAAATGGRRWGDGFTETACELGRLCARQLGLPATVQSSLLHVYDRWQGGTRPDELRGQEIPIASRIARLTGIAVLFQSQGGTDLALAALRRRAGGMLDPGLVTEAAGRLPDWLAEPETPLTGLLDLEPEPHVTVADVRPVATVFADLADLKSPWFLGHSRGVARLASEAADLLGLSSATRSELEIAGLLHDVGRVGVSNAVWEKPGPLDTHESEQVRLHPYLSERILSGSTELGRLTNLVGRHHERLDGSGYHRGCTATDLSLPARVLATADAYRTLVEDRPHRPALPPGRAAERLLSEASCGRLDRDVVRAVLTSAGHRTSGPAPRRQPALSAREVEVLDLLAHGCSNAEIAERLVISRRTAEHHVQHVYAKIGVASRAAATLFAVEHQLLDRDG